MVYATHLRIVFRVNGVDFVMPVADLLAIRGAEEYRLIPLAQPSDRYQVGSMVYKEIEVQVYDLVALFDLAKENQSEQGPLLIFAGSDFPWAVKVDCIDGVIDAERFEFQDLPAYLFQDEPIPYHQVALYEGRLLISVDSRQIGRSWRLSA